MHVSKYKDYLLKYIKLRRHVVYCLCRSVCHTVDEIYEIWPPAMKFGSVIGLWQIDTHLFPELGELWFGGPAIPCDDTHQSFTDALVIFSD